MDFRAWVVGSPRAGARQSGALGLLLVSAMAWAQPVAAACDPRDLADAVVVSLETTSVCEPVCEDKYRCYGAAILGGALTVVANREGQERVDLFCNAVQGQASEVIGQVQEVLKYQFVQEQLGKVSGYLSDYASDAQQVTAIIKCACATERLNIKNQNSFGACANYMLQGVGCGSIDFKTGVIESCTPGGKIIQDFFNATWGGLKSIGCDSNLTSWLFDCGVGGTAGPRFTQCYAGYQSDMNGKCRVCGEVANGIALPNGRCGCAAAYVPAYVYHSNTPVLASCTCAAPYQQVGDLCVCPPNMMIKGSDCVPCADYEKYVPLAEVAGVPRLPSCQACEIGYRQSKTDPTRCVPGWACDQASGEVPDPETYGRTCIRCNDRQRIATDEPIYKHRCEDCVPGSKATPDHTRCVPECPAGQITNTAMGAVVLGKAPPACIECAAGERAVYDRPGSSIGQCMLPSKVSLPLVKQDCAAQGPDFINDPGNPTRCLRCPEGQQPDAARNACVLAPRLPLRELRPVEPARQDGRSAIRPELQPRVVPATKDCPRGTRLDPASQRCVPDTD